MSFQLAPRINAVGRMGEALRGVRLLLTDDPREAEEIALTLEAENRWRQSVEGQTVKEALNALELSYDPDRDWGLVLASDGWHPGVIGIVASRMVERLHRPDGDDRAGRSGGGKGERALHPRLQPVRGHPRLLRAPGRASAGTGWRRGAAIRADRVDGFRDAFNARARAARCTEDDLVPEVRIDLEVELRHADHDLVRMLRHAGPFGAGNATPVFAARGVAVADHRVVGQGHLKMTLGAYGTTLDAIGFGMGQRGAGARLWAAAAWTWRSSWRRTTTTAAPPSRRKLVDFRPAE